MTPIYAASAAKRALFSVVLSIMVSQFDGQAAPLPAQAVEANATGSENTPMTLDADDPGYGGWEGDAYPWSIPKSNSSGGIRGDGMVTFMDWNVIAQMALGTMQPVNGDHFAVSDCAPRESLGDGALTVADVIQAFRYATDQDSCNYIGGPTNSVANRIVNRIGPARSVSLESKPMLLGCSNTVSLFLDGFGGEAAVAGTLLFDPAQLRFQSIQCLNTSVYVSLLTNALAITNGQLAFIWMTSSNLPAGRHELAQITFIAATHAESGAAIEFTNNPTICEAVNDNADVLLAAFKDAEISFASSRLVTRSVSASGVQIDVYGQAGQYSVEKSPDLSHWTQTAVITNSSACAAFREDFSPGNETLFYRAVLLK